MTNVLKQGHRRKNWKVRLFVLRSEPAFLHYFDPTKVSKPPPPPPPAGLMIHLWPPARCESGLSLSLIHVLFQDDVTPAGGFSLRGCLVSSLEDNGVPSGEAFRTAPPSNIGRVTVGSHRFASRQV